MVHAMAVQIARRVTAAGAAHPFDCVLPHAIRANSMVFALLVALARRVMALRITR